jgi:Leucine-rich repeat (LRR) protein
VQNGATSLVGIEAFTALVSLDCSNNNISTLDLSSNRSLQSLSVGKNLLTNLDLSSNNNLRSLNCYWNRNYSGHIFSCIMYHVDKLSSKKCLYFVYRGTFSIFSKIEIIT